MSLAWAPSGSSIPTITIQHATATMAANLKARTPLYVGLGLAGMGSYYLYQAGGDPKTAKDQLKGGSWLLPIQCAPI